MFAFTLVLVLSSVAVGSAESYSRNFLCRQNNCVNPVFPAYNDLMLLEGMSWQCPPMNFQFGLLHFCKDVVNYAPALPNPNETTTVASLIQQQDDAAKVQYFYHLSAMGFDAWDYQPGSQAIEDNSCVDSVRTMVCNTYFPRPDAGCEEGQATSFLKPCVNVCSNYLDACNVECCDEAPTCVFEHDANSDVLQQPTVNSNYASLLSEAQEAARTLQETTRDMTITQTGYSDVMGPSAFCTGSGHRAAPFPVALILGLVGFQFLWNTGENWEYKIERKSAPSSKATGRLSRPAMVLLLLVLAISLQGCSIPQHSEAYWRQKDSYLKTYDVEGSAVVNSCSHAELSNTEKCSGHGYCMPYDPELAMTDAATMFCKCNAGWADPECGTKRQSQIAAFCYSVFLGIFGADLYYLGYPVWATFKLLTLGGLGIWYVYDIIRIGSSSVYSGSGFRVEHNLSFSSYVIGATIWFLLLSFLIALGALLYVREHRRHKHFHQNEQEDQRTKWTEEELEGNRFWGHHTNPRRQTQAFALLKRDFKGYGATLPFKHPNAGAAEL